MTTVHRDSSSKPVADVADQDSGRISFITSSVSTRPRTSHGRHGDLDLSPEDVVSEDNLDQSWPSRENTFTEQNLIPSQRRRSDHLSDAVNILRLDNDDLNADSASSHRRGSSKYQRRTSLEMRQVKQSPGTDKRKDSMHKSSRNSVDLFPKTMPPVKNSVCNISEQRRRSLKTFKLEEKEEVFPSTPRRPSSSLFNVLPSIGNEDLESVRETHVNQPVSTMTTFTVPKREKPKSPSLKRASIAQGSPSKDYRENFKASTSEHLRPLETAAAAARAPATTAAAATTRAPAATAVKAAPKHAAVAQQGKIVEPTRHHEVGMVKLQQPKNLNKHTSVLKSSQKLSSQSGSGYNKLTRSRHVIREPSDSEHRVALAIKLPTGKRIQRYFRPTDKLKTVMAFAEMSAGLDFIGCELVCSDPWLVLSDMSKDIAESGLSDRVLLHIQQPDD